MNMDLVALPHVIECFGKQEMEVSKGTYGSARCSNGQGTKYTIKVDSGFELLYRLARGMPSLFDLCGKVVGGKRKRNVKHIIVHAVGVGTGVNEAGGVKATVVQCEVGVW